MDAMFTILNKGGTDLIYSTYLGTASYDRAENIKLSGSKYVYVVGFTDSSAFPVKSGSYDTTHNGGRDIFVLGWSTPNRPPTASGGIDTEVSLGTPIDFDGSGSSDLDGTIVSYDWDFGDGTAHGSGATPTHLYTDHGTYTVTLTVTDDDGATHSDTITVTILNNPPSANAGADQSVYLGTTTYFDGTSSSDIDGTIVSYDWDFGDESTHGTGVTPSHDFPDHGTYTVTLIVTDDDGATDTDTCVITILNNPPTSDAGMDQTVYLGTTVSLDGSGSSDVDGTIVSYDWDFGDGTTHGTGVSTSHDYNDHGVYTVKLTVTDNDGAIGIDTCVVQVLNNPPIADAGGDQTLIVGETGSFDGTGSYDVDGTIVSYKWDFGDGTDQSSGSKVTHAYSSSGTYTVTLTVTDDDGDTDSDTLEVEVLTPSQALFILIGIKEAMGLNKGLETSLDAKLDAAQASLANGNDETAINQLKAFINEVEAQRAKGLTDAQADLLVDYAEWIIDNI